MSEERSTGIPLSFSSSAAPFLEDHGCLAGVLRLSDISKPLHHRVFAVVVHYCEPARGGIEPNLVFQIRPVQFEKIVTQKGSGDMITGLPRTSFFIVDLAIMEDSGVNLAVLMIQKAVDRRVLLPT